jgi:hypothetical protein
MPKNGATHLTRWIRQFAGHREATDRELLQRFLSGQDERLRRWSADTTAWFALRLPRFSAIRTTRKTPADAIQ